MENISNLSSNLPPTKPINEESLKEINTELSLEFKNAAKSVASLYKLSLQKNSMLRYNGYLDCINDLLSCIKNGENIENWALMKKLELEGRLNETEDTNEDKEEIHHLRQRELQIPTNYEFSVSHAQTHKFPPSMPILSVDHSHHVTQRYHDRKAKSFKHKDSPIESNEPHLSSSEDDDAIIDEGLQKRRFESRRLDKRPKVQH